MLKNGALVTLLVTFTTGEFDVDSETASRALKCCVNLSQMSTNVVMDRTTVTRRLRRVSISQERTRAVVYAASTAPMAVDRATVASLGLHRCITQFPIGIVITAQVRVVWVEGKYV